MFPSSMKDLGKESPAATPCQGGFLYSVRFSTLAALTQLELE